MTVPAEVSVVVQRARRVCTPCGQGDLVWHIWGEQGANPALPPLLLLHGGSGSWTHWLRNVLPLAASGRRVLVPDLPGFGDSALPTSGTDADAMPAPIELGLAQLLGNTACDVAGFSFGGLSAGLLASKFPARVARLVLIGAPGMGLKVLVPFKLKAWRHLPGEAQRLAVHRVNLQLLMLNAPEAITPLACQLQSANALRDRLPKRRLSNTDILARTMPGLRCPVQAVYGEHDPLYKGQIQAYENALQKAPGFRGMHAIAAAGHWAQFEQADAFNQRLLALLETPHGPVQGG
jgi:pimeloyl-ACP methyl ester carboxylesterase